MTGGSVEGPDPRIRIDEEAGTHQSQLSQCRVAPEAMWVPLFVKRPGQTNGQTADANVQTIDVLPTIADVLGVEFPWPGHGRTAYSTFERGQQKTFFQNRLHPFMAGRAQSRAGRTPSRRLHHRLGFSATRRARAEGSFDDVDPSAAPLPALVTGHLDGPSRGGGSEPLAFALNGTVAAVAPTFESGEESGAFAVHLPPEMFRSGENRVAIYTVGSEDRFMPVPIV